MSHTQETDAEVRVHAENVGGIDETDVSFGPGITVLAGRNATNRTSFLQAIMAALGGNDASLKGDAERGSVELRVGDETFTRTLARRDGTVVTDGDPYLDDPAIAELFAFLLESNEARRAVAQSDDLRDLMLRPVDTDAIQAEIERLEAEKRTLDSRLEELDDLKRRLPELERKRQRLESEIANERDELEEREAEIEDAETDVSATRETKSELDAKLEELRETRSALEDARFAIEAEEESIEALRRERADLRETEADLPDAPADELAELDDELARLRDRKQRLDSTVSELQTIVEFNEEMLAGTSPELRDALALEAESHSPDEPTDQLLADDRTVVCWTCGTAVEKAEIESTLERLRTLRRDKLDERSEVRSRIDEVEAEKQTLQSQRDERERTERRLEDVEAELTDRSDRLEDLREERRELTGEIERLEREVEELEQESYDALLDLHREANQLEFDLDRLESDLEETTREISEVEARLDEEERLEAERETVQSELADLRTRIDRIEADAVESFNEHMATILDLLDYSNLERIWIERKERDVRGSRRGDSTTVFDLHVTRLTESGATYEDAVDHLSESEREVTGLVFALAGYLVHDVHEQVPFMLLDSLEAIDAERIATLVEYFDDYADYLVVALLPEDAAELDVDHHRVTDI